MYAQTILQLHSQLRQLGASDEDQKYLAAAYYLAAELFSGQYRGSGKTFVAHLIGTASILIAHRAPLAVTAAGLLHAAYESGDFGVGFLGRYPDGRIEVARIIGTEAEDLAFAYSRLAWEDASIRTLAETPMPKSSRDRNVLLIRLANELEIHLDLGIHFSRNPVQQLERLNDYGSTMVNLARELGHAKLADELEQTFAECRSADFPAELSWQKPGTFLQIPRSCTRRFDRTLRSFVGRRLPFRAKRAR
jgi:(p)ppGpp synthase/HD superfamily hydrolase